MTFKLIFIEIDIKIWIVIILTIPVEILAPNSKLVQKGLIRGSGFLFGCPSQLKLIT
jgi:hypothetical protein